MNDGGPAFPQQFVDMDGAPAEICYAPHASPGMSLRDYFAAKATDNDIFEFLPATQGETVILCEQLGIKMNRLRVWAKFQHADAMLAERNKEAKP